MLAIKYPLALIAGISVLVLKRGIIANDMVNADSKGSLLESTVQGWSSSNGQGIFGAVPILTASNALESAIRTASMHAEQSSRLIDEQAKSFAKKPDFLSVGALPIARKSTTSLTDAQDKYSISLINITPPSNKVEGERDKADFDILFSDAAET
ncbi:uncharacterized protein RAG0_02234 [Rhynchosporium agropyri]|uniref:Uncharacterized protein n=1 Tax=Rhynchosporium agropyri TaxID=914238 RepID=A0A1E1K0W5_9HELO|nr:uncharacterized protein RAG0_02234 [Rhynchosporium agropyri]